MTQPPSFVRNFALVLVASVKDIRGQLKCDGTRAETIFRLSGKRTSPFKSARASVQSTTGSRGVRISGSNVGYTMFRGSVKGWLSTPFASFPFTSPTRASPCAITFQLESTNIFIYLFIILFYFTALKAQFCIHYITFQFQISGKNKNTATK